MIANLTLIENTNPDNQKGLNNVNLEQLSRITNNFVAHLDCICLDEYDFNTRKQALVDIYHKLAIGGSATLKFISLDLLSSQIEKLELTGAKFSSILPNIKSVWSESETFEILNQLNFNITEMHYTNIYTIITVEKTK